MVSETFIIVPTESGPTLCPEQEVCYTLNEYVSNSSLSSDLDTITLEFQPGTHTLDVPFAVSDFSSFTMRGIDHATLECKETFRMTSTVNASFQGMTFINCGGRESIVAMISAVTNLILEDSVFQSDEPFSIQSTTNIQIINSTFTRSSRGVLSIFSPVAVLIRNCIFSDNIQASHSSGGLVSISGGLSTSVTIESTIFKNNHMTGRQATGAFRGSGHTLTIVNSTFIENSGGPIGTGAVCSDFESVTISRSEFSGNYAQESAGAVTITGRNTVAIITNRTEFFNNTSIGGSTSGGAVDVQSAENSSITIENTTFKLNNGTRGGAFGFITDNSSISFSDCNFTQNTGEDRANGGAVDILGSNVSLTVQHSRFVGNRITGRGGAMFLQGDLRMVLINETTFESNSANEDGAISVFYFLQNDDSRFIIANSIFTSNSARLSCGVLSVASALIRQEDLLHSRTIHIISSEFRSNTQNLINRFGSGAMCFSYTNALLVNSNFSGNSQRALTVRQSEITVDGCIFSDKFVQRDGGAVYGNSINGTFNQSVFTNNRAGSSSLPGSGGAVYLRSESQVAFYDSTFKSNVAARGGAVAIDNGGALNIDESNIFFNNTSSLGIIISACDDTKIDINVSNHLIPSTVDETTSRTYIVYLNQMNNNAKSIMQMSFVSFTIFVSSVIIRFLLF